MERPPLARRARAHTARRPGGTYIRGRGLRHDPPPETRPRHRQRCGEHGCGGGGGGAAQSDLVSSSGSDL
ncbi:hypothetical protein EYF80_028557 [Liparis tanakae]|uniref:Uncharacterized protein n=1 Tax=Liparis tanakae TaxID=230148 RepID=A0A4Z2H916_9TELE|nr:hypothetical protein EYF80_028557 [Liparis tanakae]